MDGDQLTGHESVHDDTGEEYVRVYYWCRDCVKERHDYVEISKFAGVVPRTMRCTACGKKECPVTKSEF